MACPNCETKKEKLEVSPNEYRDKISNAKLPEDLYKLPEKELGITFNDNNNKPK